MIYYVLPFCFMYVMGLSFLTRRTTLEVFWSLYSVAVCGLVNVDDLNVTAR